MTNSIEIPPPDEKDIVTAEQIMAANKAVIDLCKAKAATIRPSDIKEALSEVAVGQDHVKKVLSMAGYRHLRSVGNDEVRLPRLLPLIYGPSGSGKTLLTKALADHLKLPFFSVDCGSLVSSGYVGNKLSNYFLSHVQNWGIGGIGDYAIVFLDEIDKLSTKGSNEDITTVAVQEELLKVIEGQIAITHQERQILLDTSKMLFVGAGAFTGLEGKRKKSPIGFSEADAAGDETDVLPLGEVVEQLHKEGILLELLGRFSLVTRTKQLTESEMIELLKKDGSLMNRHKEEFAAMGAELIVKDCAYAYLVQEVKKIRTGARGLNSLLENKLLNLSYSIASFPLNSPEVVLDRDSLESGEISVFDLDGTVLRIKA